MRVIFGSGVVPTVKLKSIKRVRRYSGLNLPSKFALFYYFGHWLIQQFLEYSIQAVNIVIFVNKNSSGDEIANVNFFTTTSYMYRPATTPIEPTS